MRIFLTVFATCFLFIACSNAPKTEAEKRFGKIELEIPAFLNDKPEVVAFIKDMSQTADNYAVIIDDVVEKAKPYQNTNFEDLSTFDKIKLTTIVSEAGFKSLEMIAKWSEFAEKRIELQKEMTEDELRAFELVFERFQTRMKQIEKKHTVNFGDK